MNQNKADDKVTEAEYVIRLKAYEEKIQKKITEWKFTQTDIDALNSINHKKLVF